MPGFDLEKRYENHTLFPKNVNTIDQNFEIFSDSTVGSDPQVAVKDNLRPLTQSLIGVDSFKLWRHLETSNAALQ